MIAVRSTPFAEEAVPAEPTPSMIARRPEEILGGVANVEGLLQRAQDEFRAGNRESASQALVEAALAYERLGRLDSAATIFRSLGRGANAPVGVMELWLANCERRQHWVEAAAVCCELGDFALAAQEPASAHEWFVQARAHDPNNEQAARRLERLSDWGNRKIEPQEVHADRATVSQRMPEDLDVDLSEPLSAFQAGVREQVAAQWYERALEAPDLVFEAKMGLRSELGPAHEAAGNGQAALASYAEVLALSPSFRDVVDRVARLKAN